MTDPTSTSDEGRTTDVVRLARGRGGRSTQADCPDCGAICRADIDRPDAHRMWARRHANKTGHTTFVESHAVRSYPPAEPCQAPEQPMCQETHTGAWEDHCTLPLGHPSETAHVDERGHRWWDR